MHPYPYLPDCPHLRARVRGEEDDLPLKVNILITYAQHKIKTLLHVFVENWLADYSKTWQTDYTKIGWLIAWLDGWLIAWLADILPDGLTYTKPESPQRR